MLIAAYTCCGKTTAAQKLGPDLLDLPSMPYRWLMPFKDLSLCDSAELEQEKGALYRIADPRFPENYVLDILKAEHRGKIVLFPTIVPVIDMLTERYGRDVLVVYPEDGLKEEYRQRCMDRGNSESFQHLFIDDWEDRIGYLKESGGRHLRLKSGEYLLSVLPELLRGRPHQPAASPTPDRALAQLRQKVAEQGKEPILWLDSAPSCATACQVDDLDRPAVRSYLDAIGRAAYERDLDIFFLPKRLLHIYEQGCSVTWAKDLDEFYQAVTLTQ